MKKVNITFEFPDDFEPCTYGCENDCPCGYYDCDFNDICCDYIYEQDGNFTCLVKESIKKYV